jgi:hypothetical protein
MDYSLMIIEKARSHMKQKILLLLKEKLNILKKARMNEKFNP